MTRTESVALAQQSFTEAQAALDAAQTALTAAQNLPLDRFISTAEGLDAIIDFEGKLLPGMNVRIYDVNGGQWGNLMVQGQSFLVPVSGQCGTDAQQPATLVQDANGKPQFLLGGGNKVPLPLLFHVTRYHNDAENTEEDIEIPWAFQPSA